jgi:acetyl-CoA acyltransferase
MSESPKAVIVGGVRTPFTRAFAELLQLDAIDLGAAAVNGALDRYGIDPEAVDAMVWGGVVLPSASPNVGREIAIEIGLRHDCEAMTVTRACASGLQAITSAAAMIERGEADVVIAGGGDSTSNMELKLPQKVVHTFAPVALGKKIGLFGWFKLLAKLFPPWSVLPGRPKIAERSTGEVMGEAAEKMGKAFGIGRQSMDEFAVRSHHRAAAAWEAGILADEVVAVQTDQKCVAKDGMIRADTSGEKLARLRPVFAADGELTAGNSSPLTDGAGAVILMSEEKAKELGVRALARLRSWAYIGVDPADQLLIGPALAMPKALERAGLELSDMDLVDIHEAFAAQVLSVLKAMEDPTFCAERLGRDTPFDPVPLSKLNIHGGSLALGHPFAATGARMVTSMARALQEGDRKYALLGICAAGGLGAAAVLERIDR